MALNEKDKERIKACVKRPATVWEGIKSIITVDKYTWYLEELAKIHIMPNIAERKEKWDSMDDDTRKYYMHTDDYDIDIRRVLSQVSQVLGGDEEDDFQIGAKIGIWKKAQTMKRYTALKAALAFRFTIDEAKELLFKVLADKEQFDFNPRLVNEMLYVYAITNGLSYRKTQQLIEKAKKEYLTNVFSDTYSKYFDELIEHYGKEYNLFAAQNMTATGFYLTLISMKDGNSGSSSDISHEASKIEDSDETEEIDESRLTPVTSVMHNCYDYAHRQRNGNAPAFRSCQATKTYLKGMFEFSDNLIKESMVRLLKKECKDPYEKDERKEKYCLYEAMEKYISLSMEYTDAQSDNALLSPLDFIPLLIKTKLGEFLNGKFNTMIKNKFLKHFNSEYYSFFFESLMPAQRDLRASILSAKTDLWNVYISMNNLFKHVYFDSTGIAARCWEYEQKVCKKENADNTYTMDQLNNMIGSKEIKIGVEIFTEYLLNSYHIYENFHSYYSRGKEEYIAEMEDKHRVILYISREEIMTDAEEKRIEVKDTLKYFNGTDYLFKNVYYFKNNKCILMNEEKDNTGKNSEKKKKELSFKEAFYSCSRFEKQYLYKTLPYTRSDIIKLAFWDYAANPENLKKDSKERIADFIIEFKLNVAQQTCCAMINTNNALDRFLLLCLEHDNPIGFLKEAYEFAFKGHQIF